MAPHSSTLAWRNPWTEEPGGLQSVGSLRVGHTERLHFHFSLLCIGEGNDNPLQCCCLENPKDSGAWWAAVYGVTQSRTRLMRLSSSSSIIRFVVNSGRTISNFMKPPASGPHTRTRATEREPVAARNLSGRHERHEGAAARNCT